MNNWAKERNHAKMWAPDYNWVYTDVELRVKRHDVNFIAKQARDVLVDKRILAFNSGYLPVDFGQLYTTKEVSEIINNIVFDTMNSRRYS